MATQDPPSYVDLVHPLYLDVPMLISFLATLEGGVAYSSEVAEVAQRSRTNSIGASGDSKLPDLTSLLGLSLSLGGKLQRDSQQSQSVETKLVRQHTAASLFNNLRNRLYSGTAVRRVRTARDLSQVATGSIVEISGVIYESPLRKLVDFVNNVLPFAEEHLKSEIEKVPEVKRRRNAQMTEAELQELKQLEVLIAAAEAQIENNKQVMRMVSLIDKDINSSPIVDYVVQGDGVSSFLSTHRDLLSDDLSAGVMGGSFKVLGKVTAVNTSADAYAPVVRRGAMGALSAETLETLLTDLSTAANENDLRLQLPDGQLRGPFLQMIPLAIFI